MNHRFRRILWRSYRHCPLTRQFKSLNTGMSRGTFCKIKVLCGGLFVKRLILSLFFSFSLVNCTGFKASQNLTSNVQLLSSVQQNTCNSSFVPKKVNVHLLSNDEYNNSVADLLYTQSKGSDLGIFEARGPGPSGFTNDTSSFAISDLTIAKYWDAAVALANEVIASKSDPNGAYAKIAACAVGKSTVDSVCVDSIIRGLALRAWHRPLVEAGTNNEFSRLQAIVSADSNFDDGLSDLIKALLISPNFLFVSILNSQATVDGAVFNLNNYQLATRLSYFLWQSIPDDQLLADAAAGKLTQTDGLNAAITRMLGDPKMQRLSTAMGNEWAHLANFATVITPGLDDATKTAMETETQMMFDDIVLHDSKLINLTSATSSFLNKALADYYGVSFKGADPTKFYYTSLSPTNRMGIFGQGSFLVYSGGSPTETHPVKRGKAVANDWVCADIPPPPPNVKPAGDLSTLPANATPRQVLAVHTSSPTCEACHNTLDSYGLAFETFDMVGKTRSVYSALGNAPIDPSGTLVNGYSFLTTTQLINYISNDSATKACLARKVMSLGLTRATSNFDDRCVAGQIGANLSSAKFSDVVRAIATSRQFLNQSGEAQ